MKSWKHGGYDYHKQGEYGLNTMGEELIKDALETILNTRYYPAMVVCTYVEV